MQINTTKSSDNLNLVHSVGPVLGLGGLVVVRVTGAGATRVHAGEKLHAIAGLLLQFVVLVDVVLEVDLGALEPLSGVDHEPGKGQKHGAKVDHHGPVHGVQIQVCASVLRETQNGGHESNVGHRQNSTGSRPSAEVPGSGLELLRRPEDLDTNRHGEGNVAGNGSDRENGSNGSISGKHEKQQKLANNPVEPHGINRGLSVGVNLGPNVGQGVAAISGVCKGDSGGCNHAGLAHEKSRDNGESGDGGDKVGGQALLQVGDKGLSQLILGHAGHISDSVSNGNLEGPAHESSDSGSHDNGARGGNRGVGAFLGQMEGRIITRHGPDNGDE